MLFPTIESMQIWPNLGKIAIAYLLGLPVGWDRERETHSAGIRTFPIVTIASCGYLLLLHDPSRASRDIESRLLQGLVAGIGFIGGGAILKEGPTVRGTATAASILSAAVVGAAVAMEHYEIAVTLCALNLFTLRGLARWKNRLDRQPEVQDKHEL